MFKDLVTGKIDLGQTFWKFGLGGLLICRLFVKIMDIWLSSGLQGVSIKVYYTQYFNPVAIDTSTFIATFAYAFSVIMFVIYSIMILKAVWRSAKKFEKSPFLSFMAKSLTLLLIAVLGYTII